MGPGLLAGLFRHARCVVERVATENQEAVSVRPCCGNPKGREAAKGLNTPGQLPGGPNRERIFRGKIGRRERIRTSGPHVPNVVLYQAELLSGAFSGRIFTTISCRFRLKMLPREAPL